MPTGLVIVTTASLHPVTYFKLEVQSCVALSMAEAEYMSLTLATQEAIWLNCLLAESEGAIQTGPHL